MRLLVAAMVVVAMATLLLFLSWAGWNAGRLEREALQCARTVDGGDQAIVDCYLDRGLPYPDGV